MKTLYTLLLITIYFASFSQQVGVKAGASYLLSQGNLKTDYGQGSMGYHAGLFVKENKGAVNILFETFYNMTQTKSGYEVHSLNLPLLLETNSKVAFQAGFNTSIHFYNKRKELFENQPSLRPFNIDFAAGLHFKPTEDLGLNLRAHYPLLNQSGDSERNYRPVILQLSLNYALKKS